MVNRLFVYGTLAPGKPNEHILNELDGTWREGRVRGTLHPEGWGAAQGYPGIVLGEENGYVAGLLFTSDDLNAHWEYLDEFEGSGYERVLTRVETDENLEVEAFIYALRM